MIYIIIGNSSFDYEVRNIIFGVFTNKEMAEEKKLELENMKKESDNYEMILEIISKEINTLVDENVKIYLGM